jgi:hypothetical protein
MSAWCSKHVEAWNKLIVKQILCIKLVNYSDKYCSKFHTLLSRHQNQFSSFPQQLHNFRPLFMLWICRTTLRCNVEDISGNTAWEATLHFIRCQMNGRLTNCYSRMVQDAMLPYHENIITHVLPKVTKGRWLALRAMFSLLIGFLICYLVGQTGGVQVTVTKEHVFVHHSTILLCPWRMQLAHPHVSF